LIGSAEAIVAGADATVFGAAAAPVAIVAAAAAAATVVQRWRAGRCCLGRFAVGRIV